MTTAAEAKEPEKLSESRSLAERISRIEIDMLLAAFEQLKQREDGEMRVSVRKNRETGMVEINYIGVHEKADLTALREMYQQLRKKGSQF